MNIQWSLNIIRARLSPAVIEIGHSSFVNEKKSYVL